MTCVRRTRIEEDATEDLEDAPAGGEAELEVVETYASGDLAVLVAIERQRGVVGGYRSRTGRCG